MMTSVHYRPQTAAETLSLVVIGVDPWLAVGQFLGDWRRTAPSRPLQLLSRTTTRCLSGRG